MGINRLWVSFRLICMSVNQEWAYSSYICHSLYIVGSVLSCFVEFAKHSKVEGELTSF